MRKRGGAKPPYGQVSGGPSLPHPLFFTASQKKVKNMAKSTKDWGMISKVGA